MAEAAHNGDAGNGDGVSGPSPSEDAGAGGDITAGPSDDRAAELRSQGWSFARIAKELDLPEATAAIVAFRRSLRRRSADERARLMREELVRLDLLTARVRASGPLDSPERDRRLRAVDRIRAFIVAP